MYIIACPSSVFSSLLVNNCQIYIKKSTPVHAVLFVFTFTCTFTITSCTLSHLQTAESTTSIVTKWNGHNLAGFSVKRGFVSRCQQQNLSCTQPVESIYCRNMLKFSDTALPSGFEWAQLDERLNGHTLLDAVGSRAMPSSGCQSHSLTSRARECQF